MISPTTFVCGGTVIQWEHRAHMYINGRTNYVYTHVPVFCSLGKEDQVSVPHSEHVQPGRDPTLSHCRMLVPRRRSQAR